MHLFQEEVKWKDGSSNYTYEGAQLAPVQKKGNIIEKSFDKLKETSTVLKFLPLVTGRLMFSLLNIYDCLFNVSYVFITLTG